MTAGGRSTPWTRLDVTVWTVAMVAAAALWIWAWWEAAGSPLLSRQLPWVSGAVGACAFAAAVHAGWLLRGRRRIGLRRLALLHDDAGVGEETPPADLPDAGQVVAAAGLTRYHRPGCALARGAAFSPVVRSELDSAGRHPCGVCRP